MYGNQYYNQPRYQQPMMAQQYMPQQPVQQPTQNYLLGKVVDNIEVVKAIDIPLDGSTSYFPLADNSTIVTKQLQSDGTSKIVIFKPVEAETDCTRYITLEDVKKMLESHENGEIDDIKDEMKDLKKQIKELKSNLK